MPWELQHLLILQPDHHHDALAEKTVSLIPDFPIRLPVVDQRERLSGKHRLGVEKIRPALVESVESPFAGRR